MKKKRKHTKLVSRKRRPAKAKHSCTNHATEKEEKKCEKGKIDPV